jgi:HSP20 family protein
MSNRSLLPYNWSSRFLDDDFERLFDNWFSRPLGLQTMQGFQVKCDVEETKDHYFLTFDLPGVKKSDLDVSVDGNTLIISGERRSELREELGANSIKTERSYGKFQRAFTLPRNVDVSGIKANFEDGVLELALPKSEESKGRSIEIGSGRGGLFARLAGKSSTNGKSANA